MISLRLLGEWSHGGCSAVLSWPSLHAPHLTDYVEVSVHMNHRGVWWVQGWLDFRHVPELSWGITRVIEGRDEAAREAADIWAECVRLVNGYHRGEPLEPPGRRMVRAWQEGDGRDLTAALDRVREARGVHHDDRERFAIAFSGVDSAAREYDRALSEWMRSADWRPFRDLDEPSVLVDKPRRAGQLSLLEVA